MHRRLLRRHLLIAPLAAAIAAPALAQETDADQAYAWGRAAGLTWVEILRIPVTHLRDGTMPAYRVAESEAELAEVRARARAQRQAAEAEIVRCRAMVTALQPAPQGNDAWEQALIDQILVDQVTALDRLAAMFVFVETTGMRFVTGELEFGPAMRMCNYATFAETNWIMAYSTKAGRLAFAPESMADLMTRLSALDFLVQSAACTAYMHTLNGAGGEHVEAARAVLSAAAVDVRAIASRLEAADLSALGVNGETRQRIRPILPELAGVANQHADRLDQTAAAWATLTSEQILTMEAENDGVPQFSHEAAPLIERANIQL